MATIRERGGRWQAIVKRKGFPQQTKTFELRKDAEKWARHVERQMDAGCWLDRTEAEQTTVGELLARYGREITPGKRGAIKERYRLEAFRRSTLARYSPAAVTGQLVAAWRDERLKEVSSATALRDLVLLGHVFAVAIKEWGINLPHGNPVERIRKPAPGKARDRVLTDEEREALLFAVGQCQNPWIKPVVMFALETAARRGEIPERTLVQSRHTGRLKIPFIRIGRTVRYRVEDLRAYIEANRVT